MDHFALRAMGVKWCKRSRRGLEIGAARQRVRSTAGTGYVLSFISRILMWRSCHAATVSRVVRECLLRSKKQPPRFYVNIPLPLAAALDLEAGESVQWQLLERTDLRLRRLEAKRAPRPLKNSR